MQVIQLYIAHKFNFIWTLDSDIEYAPQYTVHTYEQYIYQNHYMFRHKKTEIII